jgi:hypothetical protein
MTPPEPIALIADDIASPALHAWLTSGGYRPVTPADATDRTTLHQCTTLVSHYPTTRETFFSVLTALRRLAEPEPWVPSPLAWVQLGPMPLESADLFAEIAAADQVRYIHAPYIRPAPYSQPPPELLRPDSPDRPLAVAFCWADDPRADLIRALTSPLRRWAGPLEDRTPPSPDEQGAFTNLMTTTEDPHIKEGS